MFVFLFFSLTLSLCTYPEIGSLESRTRDLFLFESSLLTWLWMHPKKTIYQNWLFIFLDFLNIVVAASVTRSALLYLLTEAKIYHHFVQPDGPNPRNGFLEFFHNIFTIHNWHPTCQIGVALSCQLFIGEPLLLTTHYTMLHMSF